MKQPHFLFRVCVWEVRVLGLGGIRSKVKECHKCVILFLGVELGG